MNEYKLKHDLKESDWPTFEEKEVSVYSDSEFDRLLAAANVEERDVLEFFFEVNFRIGEGAHTEWLDIDFGQQEVSIYSRHVEQQNALSRNNGGYERPDIVTTANSAWAQSINAHAVVYNPKTVYTHQATQWFNPNMFTLPAPGNLPSVSRGFLVGPGLVNWDLSLNKDTRLGFLGEAGNLQFRAEIFNVVNHPNLIPNTATGNSFYNGCGSIGNDPVHNCIGAGALFSARDGRDIQIALKVNS